MQNRRHSAVKDRVVSVTVLNKADTGIQKLASGHRLPDESGNGREVSQLDPVVRLRQALKGMPRWRQLRRIVYDVKNLRVQLINIDVFQVGSKKSFRNDAQLVIDNLSAL